MRATLRTRTAPDKAGGRDGRKCRVYCGKIKKTGFSAARFFRVYRATAPAMLRAVKDALIFDLDGTLVESLPGIATALNTALAAHGWPSHPEPAIRGFIGDGVIMLARRAAPDGASTAEITRLVEAFRGEYASAWQEGTRVFTGMLALLRDLDHAGHPLAVLSNKPHDFTVEMVASVFPDTRFAAVLGHRPGMTPKPDPAGALEIAARLGLPPARCTLIGDSTMDLETAAAAGMPALAVGWGYHDPTRLRASGGRCFDTPAALAAHLLGPPQSKPLD
jgi:phosphoglycolate phosphatase